MKEDEDSKAELGVELSDKEKKIIQLVRSVEAGEIIITVRDSEPERLEEVIRLITL
ncbi:MAG TPA: hypothetical protein VN370_15140 [Desulfitobacteriaceae bacterium]|nr:hypothetical protein [Desulfitobacteriaceae bacterium]